MTKRKRKPRGTAVRKARERELALARQADSAAVINALYRAGLSEHLPGDTYWLSDEERAAVNEKLRRAGRADTRLVRGPSPRDRRLIKARQTRHQNGRT